MNLTGRTKEKIGQGLLRAFDALAAQPLPTAELQDRIAAAGGWIWPWVHLIFGGGVSFGGRAWRATTGAGGCWRWS